MSTTHKMNIQEAHRLTGLSYDEIFERAGKVEDIALEDLNPLLTVPEESKPEYVTVHEASELTGYSQQHIYNLMAKGDLFYVQVGNRKYPVRASLPIQESKGPTNVEVLEKLIEEDPTLKLYILNKYGMEEIHERLGRIELCLQQLSSS